MGDRDVTEGDIEYEIWDMVKGSIIDLIRSVKGDGSFGENLIPFRIIFYQAIFETSLSKIFAFFGS